MARDIDSSGEGFGAWWLFCLLFFCGVVSMGGWPASSFDWFCAGVAILLLSWAAPAALTSLRGGA